MSGEVTSTTATIFVPPWLWGGNPAGFFREAGLYAKKMPDRQDVWRVQTDEAYYHRRPDLTSIQHLAGPSCHQQRIDALGGIALSETVNRFYDRGMAVLQQRADRSEKTGEPVDFLSMWQLWTMIARPPELVQSVTQVYDAMRKVTITEDPTKLVFENSGVHLVRRTPALIHRAKFASVLVRLAYDGRVQSGDRSHLQKAVEAQEPIFSSSDSLYNGIILFDAYMGPIYGALTPAIWCLPVHRELGAIIYSLGQPLAGTRGDAAELLQLLPYAEPAIAIKTPTVSPKASGAALDWWVERLNKLFAVITDPSVFTDKTGTFQAIGNLRALLSVEQLFRRVSSIQVAHRDINARRVLLFTVLDTLEHLTGRNVETHCTLRVARKTLELLRSDIPANAAEVLLSGAERAVAALAAVQDGFFLRRQMEAAVIEVPTESGQTKQLTAEQAAAHYLKLLRDATHGYGAVGQNATVRGNILLAHHSGDLPLDLPLLGYLYLLSVLARPDVLRKKLTH